MSSLLTNNSAMVALQTLKTINKDMTSVQSQISTGKRIANARDNAALWGISTTMQTDVSGFKAISESLSLGSATLSVGRDAAETIAGLLDTMKGKIVAAQEENVDRNKIQDDIVALRNQIKTVTGAAQFNGLNLLNGNENVNILASLNRSIAADGTQSVASDNITFSKQDLTTTGATFGSDGAITGVTTPIATTLASATTTADTAQITTAAETGGGTGTFTVSFDIADGAGNSTTITTLGIAAGASADVVRDAVGAAVTLAQGSNAWLGNLTADTSTAGEVNFSSSDATETYTLSNVAQNDGGYTGTIAGGGLTLADATLDDTAAVVTLEARTVAEGDSYRLTLNKTGGGGAVNFDYVATAGDTLNDVAAGLAAAVAADESGDFADVTVATTAVADPTATNVTLSVDATGASGAVGVTVANNTGGTGAGGLFGLDAIDVTAEGGPAAALASIEGLIQSSINAAASFGSAQGRIDTQMDFVGKIMDGLTSGIGALVDADMEAASARLQALQVQQQLGVQALSIANQNPQNILALFR